MSRTTMTAAFAVLLAASMPMAYAQTQTPPAATGGGAAATPGVTPATPGTAGANPPAEGNAATTNPATENGTAGANAGATANTGAAGGTEAGGAAGSQAQVHLGSDQMLFSKMNGAAVYDEQNKQVGDVANVVLDPKGEVAAVVIKSGGFLGLGAKTFAVPMNAVKLTNTDNGNLRFTLNMTQEQVKTAPTYDLSPQNTATGSSNAPAGGGNAGAGNGNNR